MAALKKKVGLGIIALIVAIVIIVLIVWLARMPKSEVLLEDGAILSEAKCQALEEVTVIHGSGCPHCAVALSRLRELEQELNMSFVYYDLAIDKDKEEILSLGLIPEGIPTTIINCKVYVGVRSKEAYREAILS